jgi:hypothetical protein
MINVGKLREANEDLQSPLVAKYLQKIRDGKDAATAIAQMLDAMGRADVDRLIWALLR